MNRKGTDRSRDVLDEEYEWVFGKKRVDGSRAAEPARSRRPVKPRINPAGQRPATGS